MEKTFTKFRVDVRLANGAVDSATVDIDDDDPIWQMTVGTLQRQRLGELLKPIADDMIARLAGAEWHYEPTQG